MSVTKNRRFRIVLFIGGAKRALLKQYIRDPNTVVVVFDNRNEISGKRNLYDQYGVVYFELGPNLTSHLLAIGSDPVIRTAAHKVANFGTNNGMGARAIFGFLAAQRRITQPDFQKFLNQLIDQVYTVTGGIPEDILAEWHLSLAGATGGGALTVLESAITQQLAAAGLVVHSHLHLLMALTFSGASERARPNAAASLAHVLAQYVYPKGHEQGIVRTVFLSELAPYGRNLEKRASVLNLEAQALSAEEFQTQLAIENPNNGGTDQLGHVQARELEVIGSIQPELIAAQVAASLAKDLEVAVLQVQPQADLIDEFEIGYDSTPCPRQSVSAVGSIADRMSFEELLNKLAVKGFDNEISAFIEVIDGRQVVVSQLGVDGRRPVHSLDDFIDRQNLLLAVENSIGDCVQEVDEQISNWLVEIKTSELKLKRAHSKFCRSGSRNYQLRLEALIACGDSHQAILDEIELLKDINQFLLDTLDVVVALIKLHDEQLKSIQSLLLSQLSTRSGHSVPAVVTVPFLNDAFQDLLEISQSDSSEHRMMLAGLASGVTVYGMAEIAASMSTHFNHIAERLMNRVAEEVAPPLGGIERFEPSTTFMVLPACDEKFREAIKSEIAKLNSETQVYFTNNLKFGAAAVRFHFRHFSKISEVFSAPLLVDLNNAFRDERWQLNFVNGISDLETLGATVTKESIEFPSLKSN